MTSVIDIALLVLLVMTAIAMLKLRDLFAVVMLSGIYSLISAALFTTLDAVDVAFTEAAVGAGISTVLMLGTLALTKSQEKVRTDRKGSALSLIVVLAVGAVLIYGTFDMPNFGDATSPVNSRVTDRYIGASGEEIGIPNIVTSVLASYRGYDTLGETTVIFTAAVAVLLLLGRSARDTGGRNGAGKAAAPVARREDDSGDPR